MTDKQPSAATPGNGNGNGTPPRQTRRVRKNLLSQQAAAYLASLTPTEPPAVAALRAATAALPEAFFQMSPAQAALLVVLLRTTGARRFLEIGTFTGITTLTAALAMPPDGQVVTLDIDPRYPAIGQPFWAEAGVTDRIRLMIGPARHSLASLMADTGRTETPKFDVVLIDADKEGYPDYYEAALALLRPGGLVLLDNVLWRGRVLDPEDDGSKPRLFRRLNKTICRDPRVDASLLAIGDGLIVACKRP